MGPILSHGHRDHYGGLGGFVAHYRDRMRDDLRLFAGGKEAFREKWVGSRDESGLVGSARPRRARSRPRRDGLLRGRTCTRRSVLRLAISRASLSKGYCPTRWLSRRPPITSARTSGADAWCPTAIPMSMRRVMSCRDAAWWWSRPSHCGVINAIRQATAVSGVSKLHAVLGGFHLGVAPSDYIEHTIAELKAMDA